MAVALVVAGLAMGAAATPHCLLMCGTPCAALTRRRARDGLAFQAGRLAGYAAGGALAAGATTLLHAWVGAAPWLAPAWTLLQLACLALGLAWLATGRMPAPLLREAAVPPAAAGADAVVVAPPSWRAGTAGLAWVAWPCGMLQGALMLAALAEGPLAGAAVMAAFALASGPALLATPLLWSALRRAGGGTRPGLQALGYRVAGAAMSLTTVLALAGSLNERIAALCGA